jgi:hypothetical protein
MGLCGIVILNLMLAWHDSPKAFISDPSSEERLRFAYALMKAAVLCAIPAATAAFTLRSAASRPAFFSGAAALAAVGAFRHTNVHLSPQGSMVGFTLSVRSIEWLYASLPVIIALVFYALDRSQRKVA